MRYVVIKVRVSKDVKQVDPDTGFYNGSVGSYKAGKRH
jgi:hypothetical protein